jgi:hypothetical protein
MNKWGMLAVIALALTGCASDRLPEAEYIEVVNDTDGLSRLTPDTIRDLGEDICGVFDEADNAYIAALATLTDGGVDAGPAGAFIALSLSQYCPEHLDQIPG